MKLPIVLGIDSNNKPQIVDLVKVGNILVGGATGQGKTNLLHAFAQSFFYAPPKISQGCIVYYIDSKGCEEFSPYFDIHLKTIEDIKAHIDLLQERIVKRETDKKMSRYPIALLIDDFDHLVLMDKSIIEKIVSRPPSRYLHRACNGTSRAYYPAGTIAHRDVYASGFSCCHDYRIMIIRPYRVLFWGEGDEGHEHFLEGDAAVLEGACVVADVVVVVVGVGEEVFVEGVDECA